jgi:Family of unknown function (DUF6088)
MASLSDRIMRRVRAYGRGNRVFTPNDFLDLGNRAAVDQALSRLSRNHRLRRVSRGLYDLPRLSTVLNRPAPPNIDAAVQALVRRDRIQVMPDGIVAANRLGLTNAVPAKVSYVTSGPTRTFKVGGRTVRFQHASAILMAWVKRPGAPAIQALYWLGQPIASTPETIDILRTNLSDVIKQDLIKGIDLLPAWIASIISKLDLNQGAVA